MADIRAALNGDPAVAFLVSAGFVYEVIAAACSSPQTTEINANARADTLMKWVHIGLAQSALFVGIAAVMASKSGRALPVLLGGSMAGTLMYAQYYHARDAGLKSTQPGTERYR